MNQYFLSLFCAHVKLLEAPSEECLLASFFRGSSNIILFIRPLYKKSRLTTREERQQVKREYLYYFSLYEALSLALYLCTKAWISKCKLDILYFHIMEISLPWFFLSNPEGFSRKLGVILFLLATGFSAKILLWLGFSPIHSSKNPYNNQ